ncbi:cation/H(+) antiporter 4-like [Abrus precatorius]|uniref:Cation/H(+) antiporter 4-like n=1 Tax=Abrus precatorius TaxID=3816 RepID=A0A8B8K1R5_ABRPR|nr:cation/H(+) antiporter 4-like [Abrus precatorius]
MNLINTNETMYHSIKEVGLNTYEVCYDAPPHIVSDGLWAVGERRRSPMKSFLPMFELQVLIIFTITQICRVLLKPLGLPLFISQMMAGLILHSSLHLGELGMFMRKLFPYGTQDTIGTVSSIGYVLFIFINGVQMDFSMITRTGKKAWTIAIIGLLVPLSVAATTLYFSRQRISMYIYNYDDLYVTTVSHTVVSFAVIASLLNELQIQNSELGRLALSSALVSDVLCTIVTAIGTALMITPETQMDHVFKNFMGLLAMAIFVPLVFRPAMFWIIKRTPEGRPVKDGYLYIIIVVVFALGWLSVMISQEFTLGAFILGLSVPEGAPLGSALVKKLQFFSTSFFLPIFVTTCMLKADYSSMSDIYLSRTVSCVVIAIILIHLIKMVSCILPAISSNMPIRDALSLALILNTKGVVEIGIYFYLYDNRIIDGVTYEILMISIIIIASVVQWSVKVLYDPSRKYAGYQKRNIMSLRPNSDLKMVVAIHKTNHISAMIDVLDLCCPTPENPITVEVLHLIELVGRALPIFIPHRLQRQESGLHKSYSDDILLAFDIYEHDNGDALSAYTCTAISPPNLMYEDVCNQALDKVASIIILPFHQRWSSDGDVESDDKNIRTLNCRVLEIAPCSVGILVSRASHQRRGTTTRVALIYLGGEDDHEALCIAKRAIRNPGINLVVYHLVSDDCIGERDELGDYYKDDGDMLLLQDMKHEPNVRYQQIIAMDGSQTAGFLGEIVNEHDFFIVGRGHGINSPQTEGLTHWSEFPELGVIGDFLSSPDLRSRASILVVQQQLSRIAEIQKLCNDDELDGHDLLNQCALHVQDRVQQIVSEFPDLSSFEIQNFDAYLQILKDELRNVELETTLVANDIELLSKTHRDDYILLEAKLEEIECSLDYITSKDPTTAEATEGTDSPMLADDGSNLNFVNLDKNVEQLELDNEIDEMKLTLKSLQDLELKVKWFDVVEQIEDAFTGLKVLAFDENCIRLSLQTYMPTFEGISYLQKIEDTIDAADLSHELLIEVFEGTMKLKNVQVFPNDILVNDIVDTAKSFSKSSLQWFIQKVQDRIILSNLRRLIVKDANKSRYSLEYLDKNETIVAHMAGGIDAYIKLSNGWPIFCSPLKLISIKGSESSDDLKRTSLNFHSKLEKLANSLDTHIRHNISSFVDAVEKVLIEQLQCDLRADDSSG